MSGMKRWEGRVALVTGASVGIGAALTERLVRWGMKVVGCARSFDKLQELGAKLDGLQLPGSFHPIKCDLSKEGEIMAMFDVIKEKHGGVDVCINNAGVLYNGALKDGKTEDWRIMMDVNILALCICSRETLKSMKERKVDDGHIIHISSDSGHAVDSDAFLHFYDCTKFAVTALTEGLRRELKEEGSMTRVTALTPGFVKTGALERTMGKEASDKLFATTPHISTEDMADSMEYVMSAPQHVQVLDVQIAHIHQAVTSGSTITD